MLNNPKFESLKDPGQLINIWDDTGIPDALFDVVEYFICTDNKVHADKLKHLDI